MAVLVDDARWEWRGGRWAHLVSDRSYDELHDFARRLGVRRLGFQGDHYDVHEVDRDRALALGAELVDSRDLVRRLRRAGLRNRADKPMWQRVGTWPSGVAVMADVVGELLVRVDRLEIDTTLADVGLFVDARQRVLLCDLPATVAVPGPAEPHATGRRADGTWSVELFHPA
ncbi:MAG: DUF4031 domain-containing protein [Acidimicrobiales bacterium]